jgi:hypothetical protein
MVKGIGEIKRPLRRHKPILEYIMKWALNTFSSKFRVNNVWS